MDLAKLATDLKDANLAAKQAANAANDDGGSSNFDAPCIKLRLTPKVAQVFEAAGLRVWKGYGFSKGSIMVGGFQGGSFQGFRRTAAARAFYEHMTKMGWVSHVHYAMD